MKMAKFYKIKDLINHRSAEERREGETRFPFSCGTEVGVGDGETREQRMELRGQVDVRGP